MRLYAIAGEASGDLHGSLLIRALKKYGPAEIRAWGGDKMAEEGATIVKHYRELAFMGFAEVIRNLGTILKNLSFCKRDILQFRPDAIILIDYPGFNLRIAKWAKQQGIRVIYYISPQVWAWKESRVKQMKKNIDIMFVILPFEQAYYRDKWDWKVEFIGHPLAEVIDDWKKNNPGKGSSAQNVIAVLPGSRKQEILKKLPVMLSVSPAFPDHTFVIARAPGIEDSFYAALLSGYPNVRTVSEGTYSLLSIASAAMVTSGTATLETALFGVPEVVCYKTSALSYQIGKRLIRVKYISLVNLIMDRLVVTELIQEALNTKNLEAELRKLLYDPATKERLENDYSELRKVLSADRSAPSKAADLIMKFLRSEA